jgi:hypothetical protein
LAVVFLWECGHLENVCTEPPRNGVIFNFMFNRAYKLTQKGGKIER